MLIQAIFHQELSLELLFVIIIIIFFFFLEDCPDQCSGKGRCVNSTCQCMIGWSGDNCQLGKCMLVTLQLKLAAHS